MSLFVHKSNRLEVLVEHLISDVLDAPLGSPFTAELVMVQTQGMAQWLKLELCKRQGIAANMEFPFPRSFLFQLMERLLPETPRPIEPAALTWRIMETIEPMLDQPVFQEIRHYLASSNDPRPLFQLAERIANLFDQYSVYRPELIEAWLKHQESADPSERWQAELWRQAMTGQMACQGKFLFDLIQALKAPRGSVRHLPTRLSIFGASSMPPIYLDVFERLGHHIPVHLFWLAPCREYWGDCPSPRAAQHIQVATGDGNVASANLHLDPGHPLLASWGKAGREFLNLVVEAEPANEKEEFCNPDKDNLLGFIQSGILDLEDKNTAAPADLYRVSPEDRSIQIHACHSPLRELQVLRDHLLHWFDTDNTLSPGDVLVMLPEVEAYAPFVKGVFETVELGAPAIPYTLLDRGARQQSPLIDGFVALLRLAGSRLTVSSVMALFEIEAVRRRFGVADEDLPQIRQWVQTSGTRWGRNAAHRQQLGLPAFAEHTWEHGRDRLLLGYAMADDTDAAFGELLPCEGIEGTATELLGRWLDFQQQFLAVLDELAKSRTLVEWSNTLHSAFDVLFLPALAEGPAANTIRLVVDGLRQEQGDSGFANTVPLAVILERILPQFEQTPAGKGFLRGAVTFAGLNPMRGIPFRVICLLGMQDGNFPRNPSPLTFDLMAQKPKPGDASRREDDRYLFLDTLLSARDRFYISYIGQSVRDNSSRPPSVVVSELQDHIGARCRLQGTTEETAGNGQDPEIIRKLVVTHHSLHPFSPAYFRNADSSLPHLFSFSPANASISQSLTRRITEKLVPFLDKTLGEPNQEFKTVTLKDLQSFYRNPSKFFVTKRLEFKLPEDSELLEDDEPFAVDNLNGFNLKKTVVDLLVCEKDLPDLVSLWRAQGRVPPASVGTILGNDLIVEATPLAKKVRARINGAKRASLKVDFSIGNLRLTGQLQVHEGVGLIHYRPSKVDPKKKPTAHLDLWLEHVALQLMDWPGPKTSCLIGEDGSWSFKPIAGDGEAMKVLMKLLDIYWIGLRQPLCFFPMSSFTLALNSQSSSVMEQVLRVWEGVPDSDYQRGEKEDPYFNLCFGNHPKPLGDQFQELALEVISPLLIHHIKD